MSLTPEEHDNDLLKTPYSELRDLPSFQATKSLAWLDSLLTGNIRAWGVRESVQCVYKALYALDAATTKIADLERKLAETKRIHCSEVDLLRTISTELHDDTKDLRKQLAEAQAREQRMKESLAVIDAARGCADIQRAGSQDTSALQAAIAAAVEPYKRLVSAICDGLTSTATDEQQGRGCIELRYATTDDMRKAFAQLDAAIDAALSAQQDKPDTQGDRE